ncbi:MAG: magnesium transporter [Clostridia bacterium]|nr:magnesium transporter [Clostridia bacterium]MBQ2387749.1 magnesium transporter [Clostridia bacterium]
MELVTIITELLEQKKYASLRDILTEMHPADVATMFDELEKRQISLLFRLLPKELAAETFVELDPDNQEALIKAFSDNELKEVLDEMYLDDAVDLVEEMPANVVRRILQNTDEETRKMINEVLKYPKDSAGSMMTIEYVQLKESMTVADSFQTIRRTGIDKETIYSCYVTDQNRHLKGIVTAKGLLLSDSDMLIGDIMDEDVISVFTTDDKEEVVQKFQLYNLIAMPVVDKENRLVGIITVDDAIDVIEQEATEDIETMAAITPTDKPYLKTGVFETWWKRIPWLLLLMVSATFTSVIINSYDAALATLGLAAFMPMIMGTGGNAGSQSSVTIIRGLSIGEIEMGDIIRIIWKELRVSLLCGITMAIATFGKIMLIEQPGFMTAVVVSLTLVATIVTAKLVGCVLPVLAKRVGFDPAVMASPFITTIVDALSLVIYFRIATMILM